MRIGHERKQRLREPVGPILAAHPAQDANSVRR